MTGGFILLAVLSWVGWLFGRRKPAERPPPPDERIIEARIRIGSQEPRMGQPRRQAPQPMKVSRERGFECVERVPE